ncbi:hypothetical protein [Actinomycetospora straminea]|uniref:Uncharacterized protein n=1 Tax=Actinomycetospora straminea TaxID=663607 RepID=A0ABP9DTP2_9PSEU|nr:hypothetical protein [Actinomycetospora straminea]MDD7932525.1 hypothetical protein [Actinomycetospora straminea]
MVALAATGALIVGGGAAAMVGAGNAAPLPELPGAPSVPGVGTTYVLPDLAPFTRTATTGTSEVSEEFGAPMGGGEAALRLITPGGSDKAAIRTTEDGGTPLSAWTGAAYSAFQGEADVDIQFPSMQLVVDFAPDDPAVGFSTLTYEPANNPGDPTTAGEWHRYAAGAGLWCSTRAIPEVISEEQRNCSFGGAKPLAAYFTAHPTIRVDALVINQGSGNPGLDAAVDLVTTPTTTYDFELTEPELPEVPGTDPCEEPTVPGLPGEGGENGGNEGHENGGQDEPKGHENGHNGGHENGGNERHENGGKDEPEGHENGGHDNGGNEGHEPPQCSGS